MSEHAWRPRATRVAGLALAAALFAGCANSGSASEPTGRSTRPAAAVSTAASTAPPAAAATTTHVFAAYDSNGAPVAGVAARGSGTCFTSSITVAAARAYRCFTGSQILDPCFAAPASSPVRTLACYDDPWSAATQLTLTARLPAASPPLKITRPWALELADGRRCTAVTGTATVVAGVALGYRCGTGTAGLLTAAGRSLQALYQTSSGALQRVHVAATWRA